MKVVHLQKEQDKTKDIAAEIKELEQIVKAHPTHEKSHDRLMILYRKTGDHHKELRTINRAIKIFEEIFNKRVPVFNKKVKALSTAIAKATGLTDKKGNNL